MPKKLTKEEFIQKAKCIRGDLYNYSKVNYINNSTKVTLICNTCGKKFQQTPNNHLSGAGCKRCNFKSAMKKRINKSAETFIEKARKVHGDKYDYSLVNYKAAKLSVKIICKKCGHIFNQTPNNHLSSEGCPSCYGNLPLNKEKFIEKAQKIHGNTYDYSEIEYINNRTPIKCNKCGEYFYQDAGNHLSGKQGCPRCSSSKGELEIAKILKDHYINYIQQKVFKDCNDQRPLPFDFYLPDYNLCIEFQGKQHYEEGFSFYLSYNKGNVEKAQEQFEKTKLHDQIRRAFCKEKGIILLEIRFDENIYEKLDESLNLQGIQNSALHSKSST